MTQQETRNQVIAMLTAAMWQAMAHAHLSVNEVAVRLGVDRSVVAHRLSGDGMVLLTEIADILWACGLEVNDVQFRQAATPERTTGNE